MKFKIEKKFTFTVTSVQLTHLLGIYPDILMPYFYKSDGMVEFTMDEVRAVHLMGAIIIKYEEQDYDFLEGLDLESMDLALELEDDLNNEIFPLDYIPLD